MNKDLEHLITLQRLDTAAHDAERHVAEAPERERTLDAKIEHARQLVAVAKEGLAENQTARRAVEKDVAMHQGRLSKFRETAMAVKTNQEYHAVQKEIGFAESEIKTLEDKILELMLEADEMTAMVKRTETELAAAQKVVEAERRAMTAELSELKAGLERMTKERAALVGQLDAGVLSMFEQVARKRNGIAVAEARNGICTICHVRLRPQVFNTILKNEQILQCDHCNRILYYVPLTAPPAPGNLTPQTQ